MASDVEIDRALHTITVTLNDHKVEEFDSDRVQELVIEALGGEQQLTVDDGGGVHDRSGVRIASVRRTDSGEWIAERQNTAAENSDQAVPTAPPQSKLRKLLTKLKVRSS
jgi:hypothetical protein